MGNALAGARQFSFRAHTTVDDVLDTGQIVQTSTDRTIRVRRPNGIYADVRGGAVDRSALYDGKTLTVFDRVENAYARIDAPPTIDEMLDYVMAEYGINLPLADFVLSDPYASLIEEVTSGTHAGRHTAGIHDCHHLAFQQQSVDWQVWIDAGAVSVPRKVVITYKLEPGAPQFSALIEDWNLSSAISDDDFTLELPAGARPVEMEELIEPD